jgi:HlyD family secretion protein
LRIVAHLQKGWVRIPDRSMIVPAWVGLEGIMVPILARSGLAPWGVLLLTAAVCGQEADQARGGLAGGRGAAVFAAVEGRTAVIFALPKGARVKKDELVCELDSTGLKERLANQELVIASTEAGFRGARLAREAAEVALSEYLEGAYKKEFEIVMGEIALAESERKRAEDRIVWSDRMYEKGYVSKAENIADKISLQQKVFAFEQALTKKAVLEKFTRDRAIKELRSGVEKMKAIELAAQAALERERTTRERLTRQVSHCKILAPAAGRIRSTEPIEAGTVVHEGQMLFRIVPERAPGETVK